MSGDRKYRYRAFLSYASRYRDWVAVLHRNLEAVLGEGTVFFDLKDIAPGESWPAKLAQAARDSERIIVVGTPEAFSSDWVLKEIRSRLVNSAESLGRRSIIPLKLVDSHWPPFLEELRYLDFESAQGDAYVALLRELLESLEADGMPQEVEIPPFVTPELDPVLRRELVELVAEPLSTPVIRRGLESAFHLNQGFLSAFDSNELAASAALAKIQGDESSAVSANRVLQIVGEECQGGLFPDFPRRIAAIRERLAPVAETETDDPLWMTYLESVRRRCLELPSSIGRKARNAMLEHVFVQLRLEYERADSEKLHAADWMHNPKQLSELLALTEADDTRIRGRWAIRGVPGAGKSTILRQYAGDLAIRAMQGKESRVPVLVSLPALLRKRDSLLDYVTHRTSKLRRTDKLQELLERLGKEGRLVVLFDGLDETAELLDDALDLIRETATHWKRSTIVVASRPIGYVRPSHDFLELDVQPLDRAQRRKLLANWFKEPDSEPDWTRAEECVVQLERDPHLWALSAVPLYLTWMAILFDAKENPSSERHKLYDQILRRLYEGKNWRDDAQPLPIPNEADEALQQLAIDWKSEGLVSEPLSALTSRMLNDDYDGIRSRLDKIPDWQGKPRRFLEAVAETGVLGPYDGEEEDWRFGHKSFLEALAAKALHRRFELRGADTLLQDAKAIEVEDVARWAEPYALLAGRIDRADELVLALTDVNRPLGLRALATAQGLQPETLARILGLTENLKQRSEVIGQVADHVGDSERAILLLDQIGAQAADGNDLHFVHESLQRIADSDPGCEESVQVKQACLYAKPRVDDETLFRTIRTRENEAASLWAEIPSGRFKMGSSDGGPYGLEKPQHEVELSAFRAAIVPVTVAQFRAFDPGHNPYFQGKVPDDELAYHPVVHVTSYEAVSFCRWLSHQFEWARGARLPTEAEWEYLCRAGTTTEWWCGDDEEALSNVAWYREENIGTTHPVARKQANAWGLYDVHGNVWEWCQDWLAGSYPGTDHRANPTGPESGSYRVIRGGSFWDVAGGLRSAYRLRGHPGLRNRDLGFRVVLPAAR